MTTPLPQVDTVDGLCQFSDLKKAFLRFMGNINTEFANGAIKLRFNLADNVSDGTALLNELSNVLEACRDPKNVETFTGFDVDGNPWTLDEFIAKKRVKNVS